ncbi:MAG TPA: response regulator transcription factor, partial [Thermomicrobiales bacterium]|nr:response regulator transcription factor [Thermomicrobiales bacterium]
EGTALTLVHTAWLARARGAVSLAQSRFQDVLALVGEARNSPHAALAHLGLGVVACDRSDLPRAADRFRDALRLARGRGDRWLIAAALERFAHLAAATGRPRQGETLLAAAGAVRAAIGAPVPPSEREDYARLVAALRNALGNEGFAAAAGQPLERPAVESRDAPLGDDDGVAAALREAAGAAEAIGARAPERSAPPEPPLSARERDVLRLLVEGRTDRDIAEALALSYRTVTTHVTAILTKLEVDSRTAAAVLAVRRGLV